MNKLLSKISIFMLLSLLFTGCEAYVEFEIFRTKILIIVFIVTLIVGGIGLIFKKRD